MIDLSLEPEQIVEPFQARDPTLPLWPFKVLINFSEAVSHIWTSPENVPMPIKSFFYAQLTAVIWSENPKSQSLVTWLVFACHRYTQELNPTASMLVDDQSKRFR